MAEIVTKGSFPSQIASDLEKMSPEYGLKVGLAIENEWFGVDSGINRFNTNQTEFHKLRLYARPPPLLLLAFSSSIAIGSSFGFIRHYQAKERM